MARRISRRDMLRTGAAAGVGLWLTGRSAGLLSAAPSDKLNVAVIGLGGQGGSNLNNVGRLKVNIVALCDVDDKRAGGAYKKYPWAKKYYDFRRMLDDMDRQIDAVVVSTPDHTHYHPAITALKMGKHLYCEKPMAHSVYEVRTMTALAAEKKLATQLGVQRHVKSNIHRVVELIRSGAIGEVKEVHSWVGGSRGMPAVPTDRPAVPDTLKWDLWLGPAAERPYHPTYAPYGWRFWWDFGTGETGNWGCHILDIPYWALDLGHATHVEATGPEVHPQTTPKSMACTFHFPASGSRPALKLHWYHTGSGPDVLRKYGIPNKGNNLFIGTKGQLLCGFDNRQLYPEKDFADFAEPPKSVPDSPGFHQEWLNACTGGEPATCNFAYSGPMTETVLLGNVAYRAGQAFDWDAESMKPSAGGKVAELIHPPFRKGWEDPVA